MTKEEYNKKIDEYNKDPKYCLYCGNPILCSYEDKLYLIKDKKFCNKSCASSFNNKGVKRNTITKIFLENFSDEELLNFYNSSSSIKEFSQKLGYKKNINLESKQISERLDSLCIDLNAIKCACNKDNNKSNKKLCKKCGRKISRDNKSKLCKFCYIESNNEKKIKNWLVTGDTGCSIGFHIRNCIRYYIYKKQNYKCAICECNNMWNNKELKFILDHIDGDASNNQENNLRLICPNCDSQLDTFKSKNKNSARNFRRKYYSIDKEIA